MKLCFSLLALSVAGAVAVPGCGNNEGCTQPERFESILLVSSQQLELSGISGSVRPVAGTRDELFRRVIDSSILFSRVDGVVSVTVAASDHVAASFDGRMTLDECGRVVSSTIPEVVELTAE